MLAGAEEPEKCFPVTAGVLELAEAETGAGSAVSGRFSSAVDFSSAGSAEADPAVSGPARVAG